MRDIALSVEAPEACTAARALVAGIDLPFTLADGRVAFNLPELGLFEVVVLE
jgi:hypothetical protein